MSASVGDERQGGELGARMVALASAGIVLNVVGGETVARLVLPIYGDSVGTVLAAALGGPAIGALVGVSSNVLWSVAMGRLSALPFAITAAVIGLLAGWFVRRGWLRTDREVRWAWLRQLPLVALAGLVTGTVAAIVSAPIATGLFGGVTGGGTDLIVAFLRATGKSALEASLGQGLVSDPFDKACTFLLAFAILRALPRRQLLRYPGGEHLVTAQVSLGGSWGEEELEG